MLILKDFFLLQFKKNKGYIVDKGYLKNNLMDQSKETKIQTIF